MELLERGANPTLADRQNATPLYGTINTQWIPKARHPQPADYLSQEVSHLELMQALLDAGAEVNTRIDSSLWYTGSRPPAPVFRIGALPSPLALRGRGANRPRRPR